MINVNKWIHMDVNLIRQKGFLFFCCFFFISCKSNQNDSGFKLIYVFCRFSVDWSCCCCSSVRLFFCCYGQENKKLLQLQRISQSQMEGMGLLGVKKKNRTNNSNCRLFVYNVFVQAICYFVSVSPWGYLDIIRLLLLLLPKSVTTSYRVINFL